MNTFGDVKAQTRGLLGDPQGQLASDSYLAPLVNVAYSLEVLALKNATGQNLEGVVLLPDVKAGTTSLFEFQAPGKPLAGLYTVLELWAKPAGMPPNYFRQAGERRYPAHVALPTVAQGIPSMVLSYCWLGNKLLITPPAAPVDIEVTGRFNPPPLVNDENVLVASPDLQPVTALKTAYFVGVDRSGLAGVNVALINEYGRQADAALDNIAAELVRQKQGMGMRAGLMEAHGWYGYRWR